MTATARSKEAAGRDKPEPQSRATGSLTGRQVDDEAVTEEAALNIYCIFT